MDDRAYPPRPGRLRHGTDSANCSPPRACPRSCSTATPTSPSAAIPSHEPVYRCPAGVRGGVPRHRDGGTALARLTTTDKAPEHRALRRPTPCCAIATVTSKPNGVPVRAIVGRNEADAARRSTAPGSSRSRPHHTSTATPHRKGHQADSLARSGRTPEATVRYTPGERAGTVTVPQRHLVRSDPADGARVPEGSAITLYLSRGTYPPTAAGSLDQCTHLAADRALRDVTGWGR